jgi:threonylcarbamoyladenosine tRNA methylthiotransferase MtaB
MSQLPTVRLLTLGCKVNQYETQYLKETLELNSWREAGDAEPPQGRTALPVPP